MISLHAISAFLSTLIAFACGVIAWRHGEEGKEKLVKNLALTFFSAAVAMALVIPPAILAKPELSSPFIGISIFFHFLALSFYLEIVASFFPKIAWARKAIFGFTLSAGAIASLLAFLEEPSLAIEHSGLIATYTFSLPHKIFLGIFTILFTSFLSGTVFLLHALSTTIFHTKIRAMLFGTALFFVGIGMTLAVLGEGLFYNFFIVSAFVLFFISLSLRKENESSEKNRL